MTRYLTCPSLLALCALSTLGCGDRATIYEAPFDAPDGPFAAAGHLLYLDQNNDELLALDPARATVRRVSVGTDPVELLALQDGRRVAVLSNVDATLTLVDLTTFSSRALPLAKPFNGLHLAPECDYLILRFDPNRPSVQSTTEAALSRNEFQVLALDGSASFHLALDGGNPAIRDVLFAPPGVCKSGGRLVALLLDDGLALFDLEDPTGTRVRIPLLGAEGERFPPLEAVFSRSDEADGTCYLFTHASGINDVFALTLSFDAEGRALPSLNYLDGGGRRPLSLHTFEGHDFAPHVLAVYAGNQVAWLHASSIRNRERVYETDSEVESAILIREPQGDEVGIIWGRSGSEIFLFDPDSLRLDAHALGGGALLDARSAPQADRVVFTHRKTDEARFSLVRAEVDGLRDRLRLRSSTRSSPATTDDTLFAPSGDALYVALRDRSELVQINLQGPATAAFVPLPDRPIQVGTLAHPEGDLLYAQHPDRLGRLTLVPADDFDAEAAYELNGFLAFDLFGWGD